MSYEPIKYGKNLQTEIANNKAEINGKLQELRGIYEKQPAVLSLIRALQDVPIDNAARGPIVLRRNAEQYPQLAAKLLLNSAESYPALFGKITAPIRQDKYELITHIIEHFDQLHNVLRVTRDELRKSMSKIGFEFMSHLTQISSYITFYTPNGRNYDEGKDYATVQCKFVFVNKKTYEVLELMTKFRVGSTFIISEGDYDSKWWVTDKLELDFDDIEQYTLNKAIVIHRGFCKEILEVASKISYLFKINSPRY